MEMRKSIFLLLLVLPFLLYPQVKKPNVSGIFYPSEEGKLKDMVDKFIQEAKVGKIKGEIIGMIAPHAGYIYSGKVSGYAFKSVVGKSFSTVVILAPSHYFHFPFVSIYPQGSFLTPLGEVGIDEEFAKYLLHSKQIRPKVEAFEREHSIEVELPFLQRALKEKLKIVPLLFSQCDYSLCKNVGKVLAKGIKSFPNKRFLLLASTDLSHYHPYQEASKIDRFTIRELLKFNPKELMEKGMKGECQLCGLTGVVTLLVASRELGANRVRVLKYLNSGDTQGNRARVVGYLAAVVTRETSFLSEREKELLLRIAREAIGNFMETGKFSLPHVEEESLRKPRAAFVTLKVHGRLRGCIGTLIPRMPLYETVARMAVEAAFHDYRFPPIRKEELSAVKIEI